MAVLQTKYVTVAVNSVYGLTSYGFNNDSIYDYGNISNTSGGSRDTNIDNVYSGYDISILQWNSIGNVVVYIKSTTTAPPNSGWDNMVITDGTNTYTYARADATYNNTLNSGTTASWAWTTATNPMGTTAGAIRTVTFETDSFAGTAPVISSVTSNNAAATSITATVNLSSNGSGGTLQYAQTTTNVVPSTGWQSGNTFSQARNTTRYYWASQSTNVTGAYDGGEPLVVGYLSPDSSITTIANFNIPNADTSHTITISNGTAGTVYEVRSVGYTGTILASRDGNGTITVPSVPADNSSTNYYITCYRTIASGGNGTTRTNIQSYTVTAVASLVAPTISSVTDNNNAGTAVTATVNLSSVGSGGTGLKYAQTTTNAVPATGWQTSASFAQARNTTRYYWASRDEDTANSYSSGFSYAVGYIAPDTAVSATSSTIGLTATSASTTVSGVTVGEEYAVRTNNGSTNLASGTATTTSIALSFTSSLPAAGATTTYEIFSRRPLAIGGQNVWTQTNDTFTVSRSADNIPDQFTFTDTTGVAQNTAQTSNTITISGMTTGTSVAVSVTGGTYSKNGGTHTSTAGTATNGDTFAVRHTSGTDFEVSTNTTLTVGTVSDTFTSTTAPFGGATYYVDVTVTPDGEFQTLFMQVSGTGWSTSTSSPKLLAPGDRVGFRFTNSGQFSGSVTGFASTHWTSTSSITLTTSYQFNYASSTIPVSTYDTVTISASQTGYTGNSRNGYYMGTSLAPDVTISLDKDVYDISATATSHTIIISNAGDATNSSITEYRVYDSASTSTKHESRTGPGSLTVTDVPANEGFPKNYSIEARVTTANGGSGLWKNTATNYDVIATTTATSNDPTIDNYGIAIYDHNGNPITSFNGGHTTLRTLYSNSSVSLSTSAYTDIDTGFTGITTSNCVILVEGTGSSGSSSSPRVAATFITGGNGNTFVRLGRVTAATTVKVTVAQYRGTTIGSTDSYGIQIRNGDSEIAIDESSRVYGVREVIDLNPSLSTQTLYQNETTYFLYVELPQGRYPASGGIPVPAISSSKSVYLIPPMVLPSKWTDGSYRTVQCTIPKAGTITGFYKLAMLVSSDNATPEYYGGTAPDYAINIYNSSNALAWSSGWRQAIVNNVINANQFTAGTNQNGTYDVTTGYDGVTAPLFTTSNFDFGMRSTAEVKSITGLNDMDPANTYLIGPSLAGSVSYYQGFYRDFEFNISGYSGGGLHRPAVKINSFSSVSLSMFRYSDGPQPSTEAQYGARVSTSFHPEGNFILLRIV